MAGTDQGRRSGCRILLVVVVVGSLAGCQPDESVPAAAAPPPVASEPAPTEVLARQITAHLSALHTRLDERLNKLEQQLGSQQPPAATLAELAARYDALNTTLKQALEPLQTQLAALAAALPPLAEELRTGLAAQQDHLTPLGRTLDQTRTLLERTERRLGVLVATVTARSLSAVPASSGAVATTPPFTATALDRWQDRWQVTVAGEKTLDRRPVRFLGLGDSYQDWTVTAITPTERQVTFRYCAGAPVTLTVGD